RSLPSTALTRSVRSSSNVESSSITTRGPKGPLVVSHDPVLSELLAAVPADGTLDVVRDHLLETGPLAVLRGQCSLHGRGLLRREVLLAGLPRILDRRVEVSVVLAGLGDVGLRARPRRPRVACDERIEVEVVTRPLEPLRDLRGRAVEL